MSTNYLVQNSGKIRALLLSTGAEELMEFIRQLGEAPYKTLKTSSTHDELMRAQGKLEVIERLLGLKREIQNYELDVIQGKINEVKKGANA